jgi:Ca2+-binding EF-hand superfamily protein
VFLDEAATAIARFGDPRGMDRAAIADFIAAERAGRRADVFDMLLSADLSGDGIISATEVVRVLPSLTPSARGRLTARHDLADADGDCAVSGDELTRFAQSEALRLVPEKREEDLRALMIFDGNKDGWVSYDEAKEGIADIGALGAAFGRICSILAPRPRRRFCL